MDPAAASTPTDATPPDGPPFVVTEPPFTVTWPPPSARTPIAAKPFVATVAPVMLIVDGVAGVDEDVPEA